MSTDSNDSQLEGDSLNDSGPEVSVQLEFEAESSVEEVIISYSASDWEMAMNDPTPGSSNWSQQSLMVNFFMRKSHFVRLRGQRRSSSSQNTSPNMSFEDIDLTVSETSIQNESDSILEVSGSNTSMVHEANVSDQGFMVNEEDSDWEIAMNDPTPGSSSQTRTDEQMRLIREQRFREREWTLEECSICYEDVLIDQLVKTLPCTHRFHLGCILPWLDIENTCPNCRKQA